VFRWGCWCLPSRLLDDGEGGFVYITDLSFLHGANVRPCPRKSSQKPPFRIQTVPLPNSAIILCVSEVGKRLKIARAAEGLSLRKFGERHKEHFSLLARIEAGERYPPRRALKKFAEVLSLTPEKLGSLIAVERRGLDPFAMLPEIVPAPIPTESIEDEAEIGWFVVKLK